ncbi:MAG: TRAP transporter small permease [Hyphomicrobiaceae bacterium]|nr:TRAP transporter small permease [Hyphomicrobiaceae bacterium]
MRVVLRGIYTGGAVLACVFLASIAVLVVLQVATRMLGIHIRGLLDYATYAMVASVFLGIAHTLSLDAHIRVRLLLDVLPARARSGAEIICLLIGSSIMVYFSYYAAVLTYESWQFNFRAMGSAATPLWIPQLGMTVGAALGALAFVDALVVAWRWPQSPYGASDRGTESAGIERAAAVAGPPVAPREL